MEKEDDIPGLDGQIEDYLLGRLPAEARDRFEARLRADPALASDVDELRREVLPALRLMRQQQLEASFERWRGGLPVEPARSGPAGRRWLWVGAALLAVAFAAFWFLKKEAAPAKQPVPSDIPAAPATNPPAGPSERKTAIPPQKPPIASAEGGRNRLLDLITYEDAGSLRDNPGEADDALRAIDALLQDNRLDAAEKKLDSPLLDDERRAEKLKRLAFLHAKRGRTAKALADYAAYQSAAAGGRDRWLEALIDLSAHPARQAGFWKNMNEMLAFDSRSPLHQRAARLEAALAERGIANPEKAGK